MERMKRILAGLVAVLALGWLLAAGGDRISGAEAKKLVAGGALLVDVRTRAEFDAGHLDGAKLVPVQELDRRLGELGPKDKDVVLYCRSGSRSARAKRMLEAAGYQKVHDLGAMSNW